MRKLFLATALLMSSVSLCGAAAVAIDGSLVDEFNRLVSESKPSYLQIGNLKIQKAEADAKKKIISIDMNEAFGYIPLTREYVGQLQEELVKAAGADYSGYKVAFTIDGQDVELFYNDSKLAYRPSKHKEPFVYAVDELSHPEKGLDGKIIAMWQSHGFYFEQTADRWQWQRARIFNTVEDLYTQSYVMPFLMPMLENAGAYVFSPRERDINSVEIIVDNDGGLASGSYSETSLSKSIWENGGVGFGYKKKAYVEFDNPFTDGTYRKIAATKKDKDIAKASWTADIPADGSYAVYVSYASLPESATDALYTVNSAEGEKQYRINQKMGGGTWIYLGHFYFNKGRQTVVTLTNKSSGRKAVVTADAVKIGGGFGNIARKRSDNFDAAARGNDGDVKLPSIKSEYAVSGYPRFTEAARYWLQWAGIPDSVYSPSEGANDYTDDYRCRGIWVNYLAGGSDVLPDYKGLNIPVDLSFAFHSDAGTTMNDSIIGSLGIYFSNKGDKYISGTDRMNSHKLTNYVLTNITNDVRAQYDSHWVRRGMWDASYFEARVPEVPAMLLELLSHQNFADMRYGLDPTFRFTVSRAIYKGMVEYFANVEGRDDYMIQPLPVNSFAITKKTPDEFVLTWKATEDTLCDRADADRFAVYERIGNGGFKRIAVTDVPEYAVNITDNDIHSYRIVAVNDGGVSFPSETLALGVAKDSKGDVLVVNGFTRISAPDSFVASDNVAGFLNEKDNGVPYINDINYIGAMFEFRREKPWVSDDATGFGASRANYEDKVIAGNTFDYPYVHGASIMNAGYSFVSCSAAAVENGSVDMKQYKNADLILGKQKTTQLGRGEKPDRYSIYSPSMRNALSEYCKNGGNLFVTGAYVATDIWDSKNYDKAKDEFAQEVLGYKYVVGQAAVEGKAHFVPSYFPQFGKLQAEYYTELNDKFYAVESPDALLPSDPAKGCTLLRYDENNISAGVANKFDNYRTCIIGFPFETIKDGSVRDAMMRQVLDFFND